MGELPFGPVPLTPLHFLDRSREVYADRPAYVDEYIAYTYSDLGDRSDRLAGALRDLGVQPKDRVSVLAPNTNVALEAHYGVPGAGAVLNMLNTRLSARELEYILDHAGSKVLIVDRGLLQLARDSVGTSGIAIVVAGGPDSDYERHLARATPFRHHLDDEWSLLSLNYTSGTTGRPKGVMYAHRGAYLQSIAMQSQLLLSTEMVFLWTLPMFHCNGWCFPWAVTAAGGLHVGLRKVNPEEIWASIRTRGVTHFNAAPTVLTDLLNHSAAADGPVEAAITVATGGAPPSPTLLARLALLNIDVVHLYGLTETYGPAAICEWRTEWNGLSAEAQSKLRARQGVGNLVSENVRMVRPDGSDVERDGSTVGEVVLRGDNVMLGYYLDDAATASASIAGWFRTGDLGVMHPDGYIELRDRAKDVIISGGENVASIEVEQALASHPSVLECAVVASPDERWGEVPVAFVTLLPDAECSEEELILYVKDRIARFKAPKRVVFGPLPKTATGKIQKFVLRETLSATDAD
ncbi:AMP-binding protein [Gemmatimonas sp.]|uniref:AMP-binding protein n=1 Tax=Gemmatimonas sp. TaxID=1962908 RepID=UPI003561F5C4